MKAFNSSDQSLVYVGSFIQAIIKARRINTANHGATCGAAKAGKAMAGVVKNWWWESNKAQRGAQRLISKMLKYVFLLVAIALIFICTILIVILKRWVTNPITLAITALCNNTEKVNKVNNGSDLVAANNEAITGIANSSAKIGELVRVASIISLHFVFGIPNVFRGLRKRLCKVIFESTLNHTSDNEFRNDLEKPHDRPLSQDTIGISDTLSITKR